MQPIARFLLGGLLAFVVRADLSLLTWNCHGNGMTNWTTNAPQVQAIGRVVGYLHPDVCTFQEIPWPYRQEMNNFVKAYLPGYYLAISTGTDGYICNTIVSRHPITRSASLLGRSSLAAFGYNGNFSRDLFQADITPPNWPVPLHVFTTHLKALSDADSAAKRAAEAAAITNYLIRSFILQSGGHPWLLSGDMNETSSATALGQPIREFVGPGTGLKLLTPVALDGNYLTWSIQSSLSVRFDYVLPGPFFASNVLGSLVFRSDRLSPSPPELNRSDNFTASDHLPVLVTFRDPFPATFQITSAALRESSVALGWETFPGYAYRVQQSPDGVNWRFATESVTTNKAILPTNAAIQFYRVLRTP